MKKPINFDYIRSAKNWGDFYCRIMEFSIIVGFGGGDWQEFMEADWEHRVIGTDEQGNRYNMSPHDVHCQIYAYPDEAILDYNLWPDEKIEQYLMYWEKDLKLTDYQDDSEDID